MLDDNAALSDANALKWNLGSETLVNLGMLRRNPASLARLTLQLPRDQSLLDLPLQDRALPSPSSSHRRDTRKPPACRALDGNHCRR